MNISTLSTHKTSVNKAYELELQEFVHFVNFLIKLAESTKKNGKPMIKRAIEINLIHSIFLFYNRIRTERPEKLVFA